MKFKFIQQLKSLALGALISLGAIGSVSAQTNYCGANTLYANGNFEGFQAGTGSGGADVSILPTASGGGTLGFGAQAPPTDNRVADDFTSTSAWNPTAITFYSYQTGSTPTSTITDVPRIELWNTPPSGSGTPLYTSTTNTILSNTWTGVYRVTSTTLTATNRPIIGINVAWPASFPTTLPAGTYWLVWQFTGSLASGPWQPPATNASSGNAMQYIGTSGSWAAVVDGGTLLPIEFPFQICGSVVAGGGSSLTQTSCDSFSWNGTTYTSGGTYYFNNSNGGVDTLYLTINSSTTNPVQTESVCDSYTWLVNNTTYTSSGTYTHVGTNAAGCPEYSTLDLTITPSTSNTTTISVCDTYTWSVDGNTYTSTGTYTSVSGCHTEILDLTITPSTTNTTTVSVCDTYTWPVNNTTYTSSGTYSSVSGCHTEVLDLTITPSTSNTTLDTGCTSYVWPVNGLTYTQSGTYTNQGISVTISAYSFLDETSWTIKNSSNVVIASGGPYGFGTTNTTLVYPTTSDYPLTFELENSGYFNDNEPFYNIVCLANGSTLANGMLLSILNGGTGSYTASNLNCTSSNPCHTEILDLTIIPSTANYTQIDACDSYTWSMNGTTYTNSGVYSVVNGCHTEYLFLTVTPSTSNTTTQSACDSYYWSVDGNIYTSSGTYSSVNGCHTEILDLTIHTSPVVMAYDVSSCASGSVSLLGTPAGGTFSIPNPYSGPTTAYTYTYTDGNGCTVTSAPAMVYVGNAVPVTGINASNIGANTATINWNGVPGLLWYEVRYRLLGSASWTGGGTQTAPTTFKNITGLDAASIYEIEVRGFCVQNQPGPWSATYVFQTGPACPAPQNLFETNVTFNAVKLNWSAVSGASYYQIRYRTSAGPGAWVSGGTASGSAISKVITGLSANTAYDWQIRAICNPAPFSTGTWSALGDFMTLASKPGDVEETSSTLDHAVTVYPNPTRDNLTIELSAEQAQVTMVKLFDMSGRLVKQMQSQHEAGIQSIHMNIAELSTGLYTIQVYANEQMVHTSKVNKQD